MLWINLLSRHSSLAICHSLLDLADPVIGIQTTRCEFGYHVEHLVGKSADVQYVFALLRLSRAVRLYVYAHKSRLRIAMLERLPLGHRSRASTATRVNPRFVVRNKDDQIAIRLALVKLRQRRTATGSAAANRSKLLRVLHNALVCVQADIYNLALERQHLRIR